MSTEAIKELREFHRFLTDKLGAGGADLSPEEALDEWRQLHPPSEFSEEDVAAIQEALDDVSKGDRGIPLEEFDRAFRQRHNIPD